MLEDNSTIEENGTVSNEEIKPDEVREDNASPDTIRDTGDNIPEDDKHIEINKYEEFYNKIVSPVKVRGKDRVYTDPDDIRALISKGADYSFKMSKIKEDTKIITLIKNSNISDEALRSLIDVYKGDKDALKYYMHKANLDFTDIEELDVNRNKNYTPKTQEISAEQASFEQALQSVRANPKHGQSLWSFLERLSVEDVGILQKNPDDIYTLIGHAESGLFYTILDRMEYLQSVDRLNLNNSILSNYVNVLKELSTQQGYSGMPQTSNTNKETNNENRRRKVSPDRSMSSSSPVKKSEKTLQDIYNIKDQNEFNKAFNEFFAKNKG